MKITLVMVLKDEARTIRKAIESVLPIVDEAVIAIDKSTTDKTKEEAHKVLGNKYTQWYEFDFEDDFSKARNEYIAKANHEWVLILDGHEYIDQSCLPFLKEIKKNPPKNVQIFDFNIYEPRDGRYFQQPRLFKSAIRYELPIHNMIRQRDYRLSMPQVTIWHNQPDDRYKARREQRRKMNLKGLTEKANKGDVRSMYYLADAFYELGDLKNAAHWFKKYIPKSDFPHERYTARIRMAVITERLGDDEQAEKYAMYCFDDEVNLNEHLIFLGDLKYKQKNYYRAIYFYRLAAVIKIPEMFLIVSKACYTWIPWYKLAMAYGMMNDLDGVRECIIKGKQLAPERDEFFELEDQIQKTIKVHNLKKKGKVYIVASLPRFIEPIFKDFVEKGDYYVRFDQQFNPYNAENADVIFCEWADHNAIAVSNFNSKAKKIIRIHAYEVFSDFIDKINFQNIDALVFVANHIKKYFMKRAHGIDDIKTTVISNGVDLNKFTIPSKKKPNNKIAYAGYISNKKGAVLLLHTVHNFPEYEFHVAGTFQEPDVQELFERRKSENLFLYPWQEDLNSFFADKTYIINTSPREGCPVAVLEGMAAGLMPLVFRWDGVDDMFSWGWSSLKGLQELLYRSVDFKANRAHIELKFDFKEKKTQIKNLIDSHIKEKDDVRENDQTAVQAVKEPSHS